MKNDDIAARLAQNLRQLREARGLTQQQLATRAGVPRATCANLETGAANPTLAVLHRVAEALLVPLEELISSPRAACQFFPNGSLPARTVHQISIAKRLPDSVLGVDIERLELPPKGRLTGVPHTPGTREYLLCEAGALTLVAAGERWEMSPGDVVSFRGDQRHSYANTGEGTAVAYSVILLARVG